MHALHATALPDVFQPVEASVTSVEAMAARVAGDGTTWLVAERDGDVVGYAHAEVQREAATAYKRASATLHVIAIGVTAAQRGTGAGRALLDALRAMAVAQRLDGLTLDVYAFNAAARRFYAREGLATLKERIVAPLPPGTD